MFNSPVIVFVDYLTRYEAYDKNRKTSTFSGLAPQEKESSGRSPSRDTSRKVITSKVAIARAAPTLPTVSAEPAAPAAPAAAVAAVAAAGSSSLIDFSHEQQAAAVNSRMKNLGNHISLNERGY